MTYESQELDENRQIINYKFAREQDQTLMDDFPKPIRIHSYDLNDKEKKRKLYLEIAQALIRDLDAQI